MDKETYIEQCVEDIIFANCTLPPASIFQMFKTASELAENEKSIKMIQNIFKNDIKPN